MWLFQRLFQKGPDKQSLVFNMHKSSGLLWSQEVKKGWWCRTKKKVQDYVFQSPGVFQSFPLVFLEVRWHLEMRPKAPRVQAALYWSRKHKEKADNMEFNTLKVKRIVRLLNERNHIKHFTINWNRKLCLVLSSVYFLTLENPITMFIRAF